MWCAEKTIRLWVAAGLAGAILLFATAGICQDRQSAPRSTQVDTLTAPQDQLAFLAEPGPDVGTLTGLLTREFTLTRRAVEDYFSLHESARRVLDYLSKAQHEY